MTPDPVEAVARAVLYEGYNLYPYRPSSLKNRHRWTFGSLFPRAWAALDGNDRCLMQTQCLVEGDARSAVEVRARFLHIAARDIGELLEPVAELPEEGEPPFRKVAAFDLDGVRHVEWEEAEERTVAAPPLTLGGLAGRGETVPFAFPAGRGIAPLRAADGTIAALLIRTMSAVSGVVEIAAEPVADGVYRLTVRIENRTPLADPAGMGRAAAQRLAFASTHTMLTVRGGRFLSLLDPPAELRDAAAACRNEGTWPVLVGAEGRADAMLSAPIILYDYPRIAPESPGDLFDGCEIDEILILRILTLTEAEKREMAAADPRTRALLERTEALTAEELARLHGAFREIGGGDASFEAPASRAPQDEVQSFSRTKSIPHPEERSEGARLEGPPAPFRIGDHVRLNPKPGADIMDVVLRGQVAIIEAVERDFEGGVHLAVTLRDDPGRDLGMARMPGHRFFFTPDEVEPVTAEAAAS